ncbi:MAG: cyclic peptide export ABC transporter [Steroidobacteraceae bacterium]
MGIWTLLRFLLDKSRRSVVWMMIAGLLSGLFSAAFLALISRALQQNDQWTTWLLLAFIAAAVGKIISGVASQLLLVRISQGTILQLSLDICRRLLRAPLRTIERRGGSQVLATLTDDVTSVTWAMQCLPQLAMHLSVLAGCAVYLAWLSWRVFLAMSIVTIISAVVYRLLYMRALTQVERSRLARGRLLDLFRNLTFGIKELMMHGRRRSAFVAEALQPAADEYRDSNVVASTQYAMADAWIQLQYYLLIGLLLFALPLWLPGDVEALTAYVFAMLYLMNPIYGIVGAFPPVARGEVALRRIEELGLKLDEEMPQEQQAGLSGKSDACAISLRDVVFAYSSEVDGESGFTLGPIDFDLRPGELVFVVGGNGSGKSTFIKLLAGLYPPQSGELRLNSELITDVNRGSYRDQFSVVFSEPYLFDRLLGLTGQDFEQAANRYLQLLQIDHKVSVQAGKFSTTDLSQGQRKRLALVVAYLEDRPIYVFDEWAADQDPDYKRVFYSQLLPDLKARGKAVVVVTHDDRYFHLGDRVVVLEDGKARNTPTMLPAVAEMP